MKSVKRFSLYLICAAIMISSCKNDNVEVQDTQDELKVEWARPAQEGGNSAAYFSYTNDLDIDDTLQSVSSPVAEMTQVHESYEMENGMMGMREPAELIINAGESMDFEEGGFHLMLMQLKEQLQEGDTISVKLEFGQAGLVTKNIPVINQ